MPYVPFFRGDTGRLTFGQTQWSTYAPIPDNGDAVLNSVGGVLAGGQTGTNYANTAAAIMVAATVPNNDDGVRNSYQAFWAINWCWTALGNNQQTVASNWIGAVRARMQNGQGQSNPWGNYFAAGLANEYVAVAIGTAAAQTVNDLATDYHTTKWNNNFVPNIPPQNGALMQGSNYGIVTIAYPILAWADGGETAFPGVTNFCKSVVRTLAYWITPQPMNRPNGSTLLQVFGLGDDEHDSDATTIYNYIPNFLGAAGELCGLSSTEAGFAAALLQNLYGGTSAAIWPVLLGFQQATPTDLSTLPADRDCGPLIFSCSTNVCDPMATRAMIVADFGGDVDHNHADEGSFQLFKGQDWIIKEWTQYIGDQTSMDGITANWAEAHALATLWTTNAAYADTYNPTYGFGPYGYGWGLGYRKSPITTTPPTYTRRIYTASAAGSFMVGLDLTNNWHPDSSHSSLDRTWINTNQNSVVRECVHLKDIRVWLIADRFTLASNPTGSFMLRTHWPMEAIPCANNGGWNLNAGAWMKTLWPQASTQTQPSAEPVTTDQTVRQNYWQGIYNGLSAGKWTPCRAQMTASQWRLDVASTDLFQLHAICADGQPATLTVDSTWKVTVTVGSVTHTVQFAAPGAAVTQPTIS